MPSAPTCIRAYVIGIDQTRYDRVALKRYVDANRASIYKHTTDENYQDLIDAFHSDDAARIDAALDSYVGRYCEIAGLASLIAAAAENRHPWLEAFRDDDGDSNRVYLGISAISAYPWDYEPVPERDVSRAEMENAIWRELYAILDGGYYKELCQNKRTVFQDRDFVYEP